MTGRHIAITGGTGYLGSRIAEYLLKNGYQVIVLSRKENKNLPPWLQNITKIVDYNDKASIINALNSVHCLIHLMSLNEIEAKERPEEAVYVNVYLTEVVLQAAIQAGVKRVQYFSTVHVYGSPLAGMIDESHKTMPAHPYSVVHRAAEEFVMEKIITGRLEGVIFRLSNGFGYPVYRDVNRWTLLINDICRQAVEHESIIIKSKNQKRDFIAITDVVRAVEWFSDKELSGDCIYNLSSGITMSISEMTNIVVESYVDITGKNVAVTYEDERENPVELTVSNEKLIKTGFEFKNNIHDEIVATLNKCTEWFSNQGHQSNNR